MRVSDLAFSPVGFVTLHVYRRGKLIDRWCEANLIVNGSKKIHARLLGGTVLNNSITQIGFGVGTEQPVAENTSLTGAFMKALDGTPTFPLDNQVSFAFSLGANEANGMAISEFGLFTAAGVLYARKTRSAPLNKDADISLSGTWTITF